MRIKNYFKIFTLFALFLFSLSIFTFAQTANAPREQKLLNGLKLLGWQNAGAEKVSVKLRIHSGSAFDPQTKEGVMALLAEILFPNETVKEYFTEDLGGSLAVESNYDYIQINATGDNDKILEILEALANAVTKPQIDKDTTAKVKAANLEKVKELEKNPAYVADTAIAKRLFGNYPYGRPHLGTSESISKIDFADILLAKQKFLTADNATLAVSGNVKFDFVYRAARRLFGGWEKADKKVPATFTQPDAPDLKPLTIEIPNADKYSSRMAIIVPARGDKDFYAAQILTRFWQRTYCWNNDYSRGNAEYKAFLLKGLYVISKNNIYLKDADDTVLTNKEPVALPINSGPCSFLLQENGKTVFAPIAQNDFDTIKSTVAAELQQNLQTNTENFWLDADTYKLVSIKDETAKINGVTFADVQRVAENLQKQSLVTVSVQRQTENKK